MVEVKKTADFSRCLRRARDPLRRFAWPRFKNCGLFTISAGRARPSAREPLRRSCASKRFRCGAVRICLSLGEPSAEIARVEALSLRRRAIFLLAKRPLEVVSWFARLLSQSCGRGFDSPWSVAAPAGKSQLLSTDVVGKSQLLGTNVVRGAHPRSSGLKIAT